MTMTAEKPQNGAVKPQERDPKQEYVAGGYAPWLQGFLNWAHTLPISIDDAETAFGWDLYARMLQDPQVLSSTRTLILSILAQDVHLTAAVVPDPEDENDTEGQQRYELAQEVQAFNDYCLRNLQESLIDVLADELECIAEGNRVAEITYREGTPEDAAQFPNLPSGALFLKSLKPKARESIAFVVDPFMNLIGLWARQPGQAFGGIIGEGGLAKELLPREKFLILSWFPKNGDPRGRSQLRAIYSSWYFKMQAIGDYLKYLAQFANPSLWGETAEDAPITAETNPDGSYVFNDDGSVKTQAPVASLYNELLKFKGGTVIAVHHGAAIHTIEMQGNGEAHLKAIALCNEEIEKGITGQTLSGSEAEHGTRAQATVHQDTLGLPVAYGKRLVAEALHDDVLVPLTVYNYGPSAKSLVPDVTLSPTEAQDQADMWAAAARLYQAGYFDDVESLGPLDAKLGIEVERLTPEELAARGGPRQRPQPAVDPNQDPPADPAAQDDEDPTDEPLAGA